MPYEVPIAISLLIWHFAAISYILFYPQLRNVFVKKQPFYGSNYKITILVFLLITCFHILYLYYSTTLNFTHPQFQIVVIFIIVVYMYIMYQKIPMRWISEQINIKNPDPQIINRIKKAYHGTTLEENEEKSEITFTLTNFSQVTYRFEIIQNESSFQFLISSNQSRIMNILNLLLLYFSSSSLLTNAENQTGFDEIPIPFTEFNVNTYLGIFILAFISCFLFLREYRVGNQYALESPKLYRKLLRSKALQKTTPKGSVNYTSELEEARERARNILKGRETDVLNRKRSDVQKKIDGIFQKDPPPLSKEDLENYKLIKSVEKILQSTPPWSKVSLKQISEKAQGGENEIETIIAGLRAQGDIAGFYDIWTQTYSGTSHNEWYITELLLSIVHDKSDKIVNSITIHPDGAAEIGIKKKVQKTE